MKRARIAHISADAERGLMVEPVGETFEFIYRDASGIRWDLSLNALIAYEPSRWNSVDLFQQMLFAVRNEYGITLYVSQETVYSGISQDAKDSLIQISTDFEDLYQSLKSRVAPAGDLP